MAEPTKTPAMDYSSRDYESLRAEMVKSIPFFAPEYTDHNPSDFGIVLIELFAMVLDGLHYQVDRVRNEGALPTCVTRGGAANLLKLIGYELRAAAAATVDLKFEGAHTKKILIPAGTKVQTKGDTSEPPVFFETAEDAEIDAGSTEVVVGAIEGETEEEIIGYSDSSILQKFTGTVEGIIEGSQKVYADEGLGYEEWEEVETFAVSKGTDKHFTTERTDKDAVIVQFGDNVQGKIPDSSSPIKLVARKGGGKRGNVGQRMITVVVSIIYDDVGDPVTVSVTNETAAAGGEDRETLEEAKRLGPMSLRALNRAVTVEDFETLAMVYPGIACANAELVTGAGIVCGCGVKVTIVPEGGGVPSSVLLEGLQAYLNERAMVCCPVVVAGAAEVKVDIVGTVIAGSNFPVDGVSSNISAVVDKIFDLAGAYAKVGEPLYLSDLYAELDGAIGVDHVDLGEATRKAEPDYEVWNGNPNPDGSEGCYFGAIETGDSAVDEVWTVVATADCAFCVTGSVSGVQTNTGTVGLEYVSDNEEIKFTLNSGVNPLVIGDRATFRTSEKTGNIPVDGNEVVRPGDIDLTVVSGAKEVGPC